MKRFLMLVGVAAVAAAMYVAAAPGSQQASGPSAKQFSALKKEVASLSKSLKTVKAEATAAAGYIATCLVSNNSGALPVNQFGDTAHAVATFGYQYTATAGGAVTSRTALDIDSSGTPGGFVQGVDPTCVTNNGLTAATHAGSSTRLHFRAIRAR